MSRLHCTCSSFGPSFFTLFTSGARYLLTAEVEVQTRAKTRNSARDDPVHVSVVSIIIRKSPTFII